jgi:hypothetical protein
VVRLTSNRTGEFTKHRNSKMTHVALKETELIETLSADIARGMRNVQELELIKYVSNKVSDGVKNTKVPLRFHRPSFCWRQE